MGILDQDGTGRKTTCTARRGEGSRQGPSLNSTIAMPAPSSSSGTRRGPRRERGGTTPGERRPRLPEARPSAASIGRVSVDRARPRLLVLSRAATRKPSAPPPPDGASEAPRPRHGAARAPRHEGRHVFRDPDLGGEPGGGRAPLRSRQQPHGTGPAAQARLGVPRGRSRPSPRGGGGTSRAVRRACARRRAGT